MPSAFPDFLSSALSASSAAFTHCVYGTPPSVTVSMRMASGAA